VAERKPVGHIVHRTETVEKVPIYADDVEWDITEDEPNEDDLIHLFADNVHRRMSVDDTYEFDFERAD
jgi:hypothetical protein